MLYSKSTWLKNVRSTVQNMCRTSGNKLMECLHQPFQSKLNLNRIRSVYSNWRNYMRHFYSDLAKWVNKMSKILYQTFSHSVYRLANLTVNQDWFKYQNTFICILGFVFMIKAPIPPMSKKFFSVLGANYEDIWTQWGL